MGESAGQGSGGARKNQMKKRTKKNGRWTTKVRAWLERRDDGAGEGKGKKDCCKGAVEKTEGKREKEKGGCDGGKGSAASARPT